ncbi:toprim domain-containing protein [Sphingomonas sp.]|uniref:toprim domain-containing protein n=1 Tax=Sphingomonas sp. TaxID=28214 RepID=UPI0028AACDD0|nr:toprim domain-containing protein [Sphingomonas sp.]
MRDDLLKDVLANLKRDFGFKEKGAWLQEGRCEQCGKKEAYARADNPWVVKCGRQNRCGADTHVKDLYPELFENWSNRHKQSREEPNAAADAYLLHARGFDLAPLRGAFAQEWYRDQDLGLTSATVRFPLPGAGYWERLIDQPSRFGKKKARFSVGSSWRGNCWLYPKHDMQGLARAGEVWITEGIFDAIALIQKGKLHAVSAMSCNVYPEHFLAELRRVCGEMNIPTPKLIWAFDVGAAGVKFTRKFVEQARKDGWRCGAAQVRPDGEGEKRDWNDLGQLDKLEPGDLDEYRWNGEITIAATAGAKALLVYERKRLESFPLTFGGKQLWANFSIERIQGELQSLLESQDPEFADFAALPFDDQWNKAAERAVAIEELANCTFRTLYFQRDPNLEEGAYFLRVSFPNGQQLKATFTGAACSGSGDFKKRLASVAPGAQWTGNQYQIDKLMQQQWTNIRVVDAIQFTGYSIDHEAWIFGDVAVHKGRVYQPNDEDFFVLGKRSVKLRTSERMLRIDYDADKLDLSWLEPLHTAYGPKGVVSLAFWCLALFADHIRREQDSLGFLEMTGEPGTGKTTLLEFLWKLLGRVNYEGFDPTKATSAGIARTLGQVGNLPVVLIEGDRNQDTPHSKRFEWDELKTAYNGRAVRTRAIANGGMETFEPPFRGAVVIAQNAPVEASPALRERIMGMHFDKSLFSAAGKRAGEALSRADVETLSGFVVHVVKAEEAILAEYRKAFAKRETALAMIEGVRNGRLVKNHAQIAAMLDAMAATLLKPLPSRVVGEAHDLIGQMLLERQRSVETDHPSVELFWERFDHIESLEDPRTERPIDHSLNPELIAINLPQFETRCADLRLQLPCLITELKRLLKGSKARRFVDVKSVKSKTGKTVTCWVFANPPERQQAKAKEHF